MVDTTHLKILDDLRRHKSDIDSLVDLLRDTDEPVPDGVRLLIADMLEGKRGDLRLEIKQKSRGILTDYSEIVGIWADIEEAISETTSITAAFELVARERDVDVSYIKRQYKNMSEAKTYHDELVEQIQIGDLLD